MVSGHGFRVTDKKVPPFFRRHPVRRGKDFLLVWPVEINERIAAEYDIKLFVKRVGVSIRFMVQNSVQARNSGTILTIPILTPFPP